jgi:hypothetical protein
MRDIRGFCADLFSTPVSNAQSLCATTRKPHTFSLLTAGEVGIDDALVMQAQEEIFEMNNGCVCCSGALPRHELLYSEHAPATGKTPAGANQRALSSCSSSSL